MLGIGVSIGARISALAAPLPSRFEEMTMPDDDAQAARPLEPEPVTTLHDPRALQILGTEHWSLLSARSLAYDEAFTRARGLAITQVDRAGGT